MSYVFIQISTAELIVVSSEIHNMLWFKMNLGKDFEYLGEL